MKVYYDDEVDALYLKLGDENPEGVIEISEGVNLDTTSEDKIVGIEILEASKKIDLKTILSYTLEFDKELVIRKTNNKTLMVAYRHQKLMLYVINLITHGGTLEEILSEYKEDIQACVLFATRFMENNNFNPLTI
jgi:uncharacterized protein YuzE